MQYLGTVEGGLVVGLICFYIGSVGDVEGRGFVLYHSNLFVYIVSWLGLHSNTNNE
jgi:hypothetical protein